MKSPHKDFSRRRAGRLLPLAVGASLLAAGSAFATNGYFPHGYGVNSQGMGGAATAMAVDSFGGANNPASMVWVGSRIDFGLGFFSPKRDARRTGTGSPFDGQIESEKTLFYIPEFGYNQMLNSDLSLGVSIYGNGGMNTNYPQGSFQCQDPGSGAMGPANMLCGSGSLGVDLMQLIVAPTVAYKLTPEQSVGASVLLGYQMFKAYGLQAFEGMSSAPGSVTNNGYDKATGMGLRLGYQGKLGDAWTFGAAYSTKVNMGRFDKYKGLFADGGDFDIPANYNLGVAFRPTDAWTLAMDYQRILYSGVAAVSNVSHSASPMGTPDGPGFGWRDVGVVKLGASWRATEALTIRAGYNHGDNPVRSDDVTINILAPGVMTKHYTGGFTYGMRPDLLIHGAFMVAPRQTVTGASFLNPAAQETIGMKQTSLGLAISHTF